MGGIKYLFFRMGWLSEIMYLKFLVSFNYGNDFFVSIIIGDGSVFVLFYFLI